MLKKLAVALLFAVLMAPAAANASWWTDGQRAWAEHGFKHGRWDCWGKCPPEFRRRPPRIRHR